MSKKKRDEQSDASQAPKLPPGVKLLRTLEGHEHVVNSVAFDPSGQMLASGSNDGTVKLWEVATGMLLRSLEAHQNHIWSVAFDPSGQMLASGSSDGTVKLWEVATGKPLRSLEVPFSDLIWSVAFDPTGRTLASGGGDTTVKLWEVATGMLLRTFEGHKRSIYSVAFDPSGQMLASGSIDGTVKLWEVATGLLLHSLEEQKNGINSVVFHRSGQMLASGGNDGTVKLWEVATGKLLHSLEAHTEGVTAVTFSVDGRLLASSSDDGTVRLWSGGPWETVAIIPEPTESGAWLPGLALHPTLPLLVTPGSKPDAQRGERSKLIHFWELDFDELLGKASGVSPAMQAVYHTTAKIVLVGDSGVGKTGLGWRLAHGEFKEHSSTHGQQFWVLDQLSTLRADRMQCEAILWDLAGQPDYRLTHALFLDDADLALVLFDPTDSRDPLHGVEFWLKHLATGRKQSSDAPSCCPTILIGARADRGEARLTQEELDDFCRQRGISGGYLATSAQTGIGLDELLRRMKAQILWEQKPATVTTVTFKRIKDYVLGLKKRPEQRQVIVSWQDLRERLEKTDKTWEFADAEMMTAVGHLANYGYVRVLRTSEGEERILLAPELLNNLATSFVLEARRNPKGLGALEEQRLLARQYEFRELEKLSADERDALLDSAALLFLEHNVCFREIHLNGQSYLVFPELINLKKPLLDEQPTEDGASYTVSGAIENVYASLVVLLGYTQTFTRTNQWQNQARYVMGDGLICGFRQESDREGEPELVLYFGQNVPGPGRKVFEGLFESFLTRRNLTVFRYNPLSCPGGHTINRAVVRQRSREKKDFAFCEECGERVLLPKADEPIQLTQAERRKVEEQRWFASRRNQLEQATFQVMSYVKDQNLTVPECFISYAWGDEERERWIERNLATDLQKAGIKVVLDRWENERAGKSVSRFINRIAECAVVIPVGTPLYGDKFKNKVSSTGSVVAAEVDLISQRLLGTEAEKETVMPVLLAGEKKTSLPPLMWDRVHCDFRNERAYFITAFDLILDIYGIAHTNPAVADLRQSLRETQLR